MFISGYTADDKLVEGKLINHDTDKCVLTENGSVMKLSELKCTRFFEEEDSDIDKQVKSDIDVIKSDLEKKKPKEDELAKAGEERAKELADAGLKEKEPDEYKTKFVLQASAVVGGAEAGVDLAKADANNSDAFKGIRESNETYQSDLHPDYQTSVPYQDNLTRDQIYLKMKQEIDDYNKETNKFDEKELVERICKNLVGYDCVGNYKSLKEAFLKIRKELVN